MRNKYVATPHRAGVNRIHRAEDGTDWVEGQVFELDDATVDVKGLIAMGAIEPYVEAAPAAPDKPTKVKE